MTKVVKLAQPGFDVRTAGDESLIYSSEWPILKITHHGRATFTNFANNQTIINHNLGYVPFFMFFANNRINDWNNNPPYIVHERSEYFGPPGVFNVGADENRLIFFHDSPSDTGTIEFYYYIFALNLLEDFIAPSFRVGGQPSGGSGGTAFKLALPNKETDSGDLRDFAVHSDARSLMVHSVQSKKPTVINAVSEKSVFQHGLGYKPMVFVFHKGPDATKAVASSFDGTTGTTVTNEDVTVLGDLLTFPERRDIVVILKDPFNVDYRVNIAV